MSALQWSFLEKQWQDMVLLHILFQKYIWKLDVSWAFIFLRDNLAIVRNLTI